MKRKVLMCVLDWGLGHATRSLALVEELERANFDVVIASSGDALALLQLELPSHTSHELPSYDITYTNQSFEWGMIRQVDKIRKVINKEHDDIAEIVASNGIDIIISDNRYGCYAAGTRNIFLSHHLRILLSGGWNALSPLVNGFHRQLINKFDEVWVPDHSDRTLSGELSDAEFRNLRFIGPLTTMRADQNGVSAKREIMAVLSGPEPERSRFSEIVFRQLKNSGKSFLMAEGKPRNSNPGEAGRASFIGRDALGSAIRESSVVIARPGYSTIMDMATLGSKCIFVPTPGQTEQEYLARRMRDKGIALFQLQDSFDLARALDETEQYKGFKEMKDTSGGLLKSAILNLRVDGKLD